MQENKQEKSPIKQNILQYIDCKGISKYEFYKSTGITRGILDQNNGISEENIARFLAYYSDVSIEWLMTRRGNMLKDELGDEKNTHLNTHPNTHLSPKSEDNPPFPTMAAEPNMPYGNAPNLSIYKGGEVEEKQPRRDESSDGLIKHLVEQIKEQSEEIGALKQEVNFLKDRLAQCAENATGANGARA